MIIKNSAKCTACGEEIESTHRHDFKVHYCKKNPRQATKWEGEGVDAKIVPAEGITFNFGVDGGKVYIRRIGNGYEDTSIYEDDK